MLRIQVSASGSPIGLSVFLEGTGVGAELSALLVLTLFDEFEFWEGVFKAAVILSVRYLFLSNELNITLVRLASLILHSEK